MLRFLLFSIIMSFSAILHSQEGILKGKVKDLSSGELLPGAAIQLSDHPAKGAVSDIEGTYSIVLDTGVHQLFCSFTGYKSDTFTVNIQGNQITERNILLGSSSRFLETVVVSSGKFDQKLEELTVSMEVLKPSLINNRNTTSIETALEQVPGLTIIDNDPQIRGGSGFTFGVGSRVAIVVDGIPLLSGDAGRPEWSYIPVENIEQVEIIKGASSVLYGSSALSGVINIRSAYPRSKPKTVINYSAGMYSLPQAPAESWYGVSMPVMSNLNLMHSRIIRDNLDFVIGGNINYDQGYIGPPPAQKPIPYYAKDEFDTIPTYTNQDMLKVRGRLNFNLRYRPKNITGLNFGLNGNGMLNKTNMVLAWYDDSLGLYKGYPGAVFLQDQSIFNLDPFIKYSLPNGVRHSLVGRVFHTNNVITNNQSNKGTLLYGEYQLQRIFAGLDLTFTGGVVGSLSRSHAELYASSGSPDNRIMNAAGYLQLDKKLWKIINFSGGFRYEYFKMNDFQSVVAPIFRAGASIQLMKATFLRASYGQGFRYPTITERYISTKAGLFGVFPNPVLQPETSDNFEVGVKQSYRIGPVMGYIDVAGFYQEYRNTIEYLFGVWDPDVALVGFKFLNTGDSRVRGVDMSLVASSDPANKKFGITALIGYTYVEPVSLTPDSVYAQDKSLGGSGQPLSYKNSSMDTTGNILKYRFRHMVKADVELKIYRFGLGVSYRYYSKMQNIDKAFADVETLTKALDFLDQIKAVEYWRTHPSFTVWDARLSCQITETQKVSVICSNLLNTEYSLRPLKIEAPRTIMLQYVLTF